MRHRPLLVWSLAFAGGIAGWSLGGRFLAIPLISVLAGIVLLAVAGRRERVAVAGLVLTGLGAGALRLAAFQAIPATDVSHWANRSAPVHLIGTVVSDPEERHGRVTLLLRAERVQTARQAAPITGDVYVALQSPAFPQPPLDYADRVGLDGHLEAPPAATNPGGFSWCGYLARRAVYCQLRVKRPGAVRHLGGSTFDPYARLAWAVRRRLLSVVRTDLAPVPAAVLSGILLGKRSDLPPGLMADFIHTGTVHILASAGLHVHMGNRNGPES